MDNVSAMITFARVVETRSFSAAARRLGLSKSAVSKQIARLEDRLGARLLNRTTRQVTTTEVGAALFQRCQRIAAEVEDAELAVTRLHAEPRGVLRVNAPVSFGHLHLAPALTPFLARYPELQVDLSLADRFVDVVEEGFDVVIRIARLEESSLVARRLAPARRVACAAPAYLAGREAPRRPADLAGHDCLLYSQGGRHDEWRFTGPGGAVEAVRVAGRLQVDNGDALRAALLDGMGIGLMPTFLVGDDIGAGRLVRLLPDHDDPFGGVHAVFPHSRHLSPKVRAFVEHLVARFGPRPYWDRRSDDRADDRPAGLAPAGAVP